MRVKTTYTNDSHTVDVVIHRSIVIAVMEQRLLVSCVLLVLLYPDDGCDERVKDQGEGEDP